MSENRDDIERLTLICEVIEGMSEKEYIDSINADGGNFDEALEDLQKLIGFASKMCQEYEDDVKDFDVFRVYMRYYDCLKREITIIRNHMAKLGSVPNE